MQQKKRKRRKSNRRHTGQFFLRFQGQFEKTKQQKSKNPKQTKKIVLTTTKSMNHNIKVYVRVRPPLPRETGKSCLEVQDDNNSILLSSVANTSPKEMTFDGIFSTNSTQNQVFEDVGKSLTADCLDGFNTTIFAYGQTGSGKTYTVIGTETEKTAGLVPRICQNLFSSIEKLQTNASENSNTSNELSELKSSFESKSTVEFLCKASICEIYNERVYDLMDNTTVCDGNGGLQVREDLANGVFVDGLTQHPISNAKEAVELLRKGLEQRKTASTLMNDESSRSHSLFTLHVESIETFEGLVKRKHSRFNLVDLAGSERQKNTNATGDRLKEASSINQSLSALGNVIKSLVDIGQGKQRHVHYRDSKLTFLLKDSLGGNSKTTIVANVSGDSHSLGETLSTLKFAQRAKLIQNKARVNEDTSGATVTQLHEEIRKLKAQLANNNLNSTSISKTSTINSTSTSTSNSTSSTFSTSSTTAASSSSDSSNVISTRATERALNESLQREQDMSMQITWQQNRLSEVEQLVATLDVKNNEQKLAYKLKNAAYQQIKNNNNASNAFVASNVSNITSNECKENAELRVETANANVLAQEWRVKASLLEDQLRNFGMFEEDDEQELDTMRKAPFVWLGWKSNALGWQGFNHEENDEITAASNDMRYHIDSLAETVQDLLSEKEELNQKIANQEIEIAMALSMSIVPTSSSPFSSSSSSSSSVSPLLSDLNLKQQEQIQEQEQRITVAKTQNTQLQVLLEDLQVRFQAMERNLRNEENKNQNLIHQKIDIDTKHKQETRMLERQLKECKEVTEAHEQAAKTIALHDGEESKLRMSLATALKEKSIFSEKFNQLEIDRSANENAYMKQMEEAVEKISELETCIETLQHKKEQQQKDQFKEMQSLKQNLAETTATMDRLNGNVTKAEISQQRAEFENQNVQEDLDNLNIMYERCMSEKNTTNFDLEQSVSLNEEIANQLESTQELLSKQTMQTDRAIARVGAMEGQLEVAKVSKDTHAENMVYLESMLRSMENEVELKNNKMKEAVLQMQALEHQLSITSNTSSQNENQVDQIQENLNTTKKLYVTTKGQLDVLVIQNASLETTLSERNSEVDKYQERERVLIAEMKQLEAATHSMESETAAAHSYTNSVVEERQKLQEIVTQLTKAKEKNTVHLSNALNELDKVQNSLQEKVKALNDVNAKLAGHTNHKQKIKMHEVLKQENNDLREDIREGERKQLQLHNEIAKLRQAKLRQASQEKEQEKEQEKTATVTNVAPVAPQVIRKKKLPFGARSVMGQLNMNVIGELKKKLKKKTTEKIIEGVGKVEKKSTNNMLVTRPAMKKRKKKTILRPFEDPPVEEAETW